MKRFLLDIFLLMLILLVMGFHFLPQVLHEVLGLVLLVGVLWHLGLNHRWFSGMMRGRFGTLRILQVAAGILLVVSLLTAVVTGSIISNHVFRDLWRDVLLHRSVFIHQLHIASSYLMVILGGMHIGMHWMALWSRIKKLLHLSWLDRHPSLCFWLLVLIGWAGCAFARLDQVGDRLVLQHIFGTLASRLPAGIYFLLLLCMMGLYAIGFYYVQKYLQHRIKQERGIKQS